MSRVRILVGDALERLRDLPDESVQTIVTSTPYYALRDYGVAGQIGLEATPAEFVGKLVDVFREARRVLRGDGTCWLNLGDSHNGSGRGAHSNGNFGNRGAGQQPGRWVTSGGLKPKDLIGIPWRVALALQADGWWLRSDIIWSKPSCMPESVTDRPTRSHEYVFLLAKSERYFYDADAVREPHTMKPQRRPSGRPVDETPRPGQPRQGWSTAAREEAAADGHPGGRNLRTVWTINTRPSGLDHFATMPPELAERCVLAGTSAGGCCSLCGAPLERRIERGQADLEHQRACGGDAEGAYDGTATKAYAAAGVQDPSAVKARILAGMRERKTVGWDPTCSCPPGPPAPCVVLDPFGGAGTTALVAARLQRDAVMVELNPKYAELARARVAEDMPLLTSVEVLGAGGAVA